MWLLFLGPLFFLSYGFANSRAAARDYVASIYFPWELAIPFWPWTIVPYWSIDVAYGLSFLFCRGAKEVDRHGLRLLTAQVISIACFLSFPLRFAFERPESTGCFTMFFAALASFDQPYNQAPSLHIALLLIIWVRLARATDGVWGWLIHLWAVLVGVSVLTTWQHHFIDVPSGALVGLISLWIWPDKGKSLLFQWPAPRSSAMFVRQLTIALGYFVAAIGLTTVAVLVGGVGLWLWWPAVSLLLVAVIYGWSGGRGFAKDHGRHALPLALMLAPYLLGAWANSRLWTWGRRPHHQVAEGVWLGRMPRSIDLQRGGFAGLCDLCVELPAPRNVAAYLSLPWLDLIPPTQSQLMVAAQGIERLRKAGPVLVCCALGYSRSACAVAAWLLYRRLAGDVDQAISLIERIRPGVVIGADHRTALRDFQRASWPNDESSGGIMAPPRGTVN